MKKAEIPDFLQKRIDEFYADYIQPRKNSKHLVLGKESTSSSIILSGNDYLSIANHPKIVNAQIENLQKLGNGVMMSAIFLDEGDNKKKLNRTLPNFWDLRIQ